MNKHLKILLITLLVSGCAYTESRTSPLQINLAIRDTFSQEVNTFTQGDTIRLFLTATNNTNEPIVFNFNDGQQFDFYISSSSAEVWRWSDDKGFIQILTSLTIPAHDSVEVTATWNQVLSSGGNLAIGNYTALGSFLEQSPSAQQTFTIQ